MLCAVLFGVWVDNSGSGIDEVLSVIETFGTSERVNYRRIWLLLF